MHRKICLLLAMLALQFAAGSFASGKDVLDQIARPLKPEQFNETYDKIPDVNLGSALVGLRIGSAPSNFDPQNVRISLPPDVKEPFCIWVVTADGRFLSENPFATPQNSDQVETVRLDSVTKDFTQLLKKYRGSEVAVRAYIADQAECKWPSELLVPQFTETQGTRYLTALLSLGSQTAQAQLRLQDAVIGKPVTCERSRLDMRFAFDTNCKIEIEGDLQGKVNLDIILKDGLLGKSVKSWPLWIPASDE